MRWYERMVLVTNDQKSVEATKPQERERVALRQNFGCVNFEACEKTLVLVTGVACFGLGASRLKVAN